MGGPEQAEAQCGLYFLPPTASEVWVQGANKPILYNVEELGKNAEDYTGNTSVGVSVTETAVE